MDLSTPMLRCKLFVQTGKVSSFCSKLYGLLMAF